MLLKYVIPVLLISLILFQLQCSLPEPDDIDPPEVTVIYPYTGSVLSGNSTVVVSATDDEEVEKVWIFFDDSLMASRNGSSASFDIDVSSYEDDQTHMIQAGARDKSGNKGYSEQILVTVSDLPDNVPPTVSIINPQDGQQVQNTVIVLASADDDRLVREVAFFVNGDSVHSDNLYPYNYNWITTNLADSTSHSIVAKAFDQSGNWTNSEPVTVTVFPRGDRTPPVITLLYPGLGAILQGNIDVVVDATDDTGVDSVQFYINGVWDNTDTDAPWGFLWNTTPLDSGLYTLYMKAYDPAGNVGTAGPLNFTVDN